MDNHATVRYSLHIFRAALVVAFIFSLGTFTTARAVDGPDLTITKSHIGNFIQGEPGSYTVIVTNSGNLASSGQVTVTDTLPADLTGVAMTGSGWTCTTSPPWFCHRSDALGPGASYPAITVMVTATTTAHATVTNTVSVAGGGDVNGANNTDTDPTTVIQSDLRITSITFSPPNPLPEQTFSVIVEVTNQGGASTGSVPYIDLYFNTDPSTIPDPSTGCPIQSEYFGPISTQFALAAGASDSAIIEIAGGLPLSNNRLWAYVDTDCTIIENNETNNKHGPVNLNIGYDDFSAPKIINSIPFMDVNLNTASATTAVDDPSIANCGAGKGYASIWYAYTPTTSGTVYLDTLGSNYNTLLAVWTGTRGNLSPVTCNNDAYGTVQSATALNVSAGVTYYIEIVHYAASTPPQVGGTLQFHAASFADVQGNYWAWRYIEGLYKAGLTGGCAVSPRLYCPESPVTRAQMAIFLLKGIHGSSYTPPAATGNSFDDVPVSYWAAAWIEQLADESITAGCGGGNYCPDNSVTRAQMAVFLLKSKHGPTYTPPPVGAGTGFTDVPSNYWAAAWIKQLAAEKITGGCGVNLYCPENAVTRAQMAVFLDKAFSFAPLP